MGVLCYGEHALLQLEFLLLWEHFKRHRVSYGLGSKFMTWVLVETIGVDGPS